MNSTQLEEKVAYLQRLMWCRVSCISLCSIFLEHLYVLKVVNNTSMTFYNSYTIFHAKLFPVLIDFHRATLKIHQKMWRKFENIKFCRY